MQRYLLNAISHSNFNITKQQMEEILQELHIDNKIRGEALTMEQFASIARKMQKAIIGYTQE